MILALRKEVDRFCWVMLMDKFPEAFRRFEYDIPIDQFESFRELSYAFAYWAGKRWVDSYAQNLALRIEAAKRGFRDARIPMLFRRPHVSARRTCCMHAIDWKWGFRLSALVSFSIDYLCI